MVFTVTCCPFLPRVDDGTREVTMKSPNTASFLCRSERPDSVVPSNRNGDPVEYLTSGQAAELLGVQSRNTVKNWLEGGMFPGAFKTPGGQWRFPRTEVLAMRNYMNDVRNRNARGDMTPVDLGDDVEPPLL